MDFSPNYSFEVPIQHEIECQNTLPTSSEESDDPDDCTIIEPNSNTNNNTKENTYTGSYSVKKYNYNTQKNIKMAVIDLDNDDDDCAIVDRQDNSSSKNNIGNNIQHESNEIVSTEPIVIEDSEKDIDCDIVDLDKLVDSPENPCTVYEKVKRFEEILKRHKVLADIIEKCLDMENSVGMLRIINRTLVPIYKDTTDVFKNSDLFKRILTKTYIKLETEPNRKFSHLKELCELMKLDIPKKRIKPITLNTNLNGKSAIQTETPIPIKKKKSDVINLDDDDLTITNGDNNSNDVTTNRYSTNTGIYAKENQPNNDYTDSTVALENDVKSSELQIVIKDVRSEAENCVTDNLEFENNHKTTIENDTDVIVVNNNNSPNKQNMTYLQKVHEIDVNNTDKRKTLNEVGQLVWSEAYTSGINVKDEIADIESRIKRVNDKIREMESIEVDWEKDNHDGSPYVMCENYKSIAVTLYKRLCYLTGTEAVKRREVRLKVAEGRPEGPVRCLERFINNNIDENGNPPFPDMQDVINCVREANEHCNLGWGKTEIEKEARSLFIHYGQTRQKSRQRREWRNLMRYVSAEAPDPAELDPELQARLEQNAKIAVKNENDFFDRLKELENRGQATNAVSSEQRPSDELTQSCPSTSLSVDHTQSVLRLMNNYNMTSGGLITDNVRLHNPSTSFTASVAQSEDTTTNYDENNILRSSTTVIDTEVTNNYDSNKSHRINCTESERRKGNEEKEMMEVDVDVKPNLLHLNRFITSIEEVPIEFEANVRKEIVNSEFNSNMENISGGTDQPQIKIEPYTETSIDFNKETANITPANREDVNVDNIKGKLEDNGAESSEIAQTTDPNADVVVKKERLDIGRMLLELGDNYTFSIIDIEDPFEVIEISDSSESEDEDL